MAVKWHVKFRRELAKNINQTLAKLFTKKQNSSALPKEKIKKILIIRMNYRIGNIIFQSPLVNAISEIFPHAKIDFVLGAPYITPLIEGMPNINKVYSFDRKLLTKPLQALKLIKEINQNDYDLTITSNLGSSSDKVATLLVKAPFKVGFFEANQYLPVTHSTEVINNFNGLHEALKPLELVKVFGENPNNFERELNLKVERPKKTNVIGIFRDARGEKKYQNSFWQELVDELKKLDNTLEFIDILDPNNKTPLNKTIKTMSEKNLRDLANNIATLKAFICADTGPMHLASATKTPTLALFKATSPTLYGTLGKHDLSLVTKDLDIKSLAYKIHEHLKTI